MEKKYFEAVQVELEWLEPSDYYSEPWSYFGDGEDEDGERWSIVVKGCELRYTAI